jgi:hypothetical protein
MRHPNHHVASATIERWSGKVSSVADATKNGLQHANRALKYTAKFNPPLRGNKMIKLDLCTVIPA